VAADAVEDMVEGEGFVSLCASLCLGASDKKRYPHRGICMRDHAYKGVNGVRFVIDITILIFLSAIMSTDASLRAYQQELSRVLRQNPSIIHFILSLRQLLSHHRLRMEEKNCP
jgi:hypothetical protein